MPTLHRTIQFERVDPITSPDALIPATIATATPVMRHGVGEVLDCTASGVDLARAPLPLIVAHESNRLAIGLVEQIRAMGDRVVGMVRFATSPEAQQIRADVLAGIHRGLSVGYRHLDEGTPIQGGVAYRWQPHEVSIVPVPADPQSGFFRNLSGAPTMPTTMIKGSDAAAILKLCRERGLEAHADDLLERGLTLDQAKAEIVNILATHDQRSGGHLNVRPHTSTDSARERDLIINSLAARMGANVTGEVIRSEDCVSLAVRSLQLAGQSVSRHDNRDAIIRRSMTTGDFPHLLGAAVGRVLHQAYTDSPAALKTVSRKANLPDFRDRRVVRMGSAPSLEKVNEHGEFRYGAVTDASNTWKLTTYGRIVSLTRQAMVNDDLGGFSDLITKFGQAASRREADELVSVLTVSPAVDGSPLFHADRSSLITDALSVDGLAAAVNKLRMQKELDGGFVLQSPGAIVVPAALEMTALQLVAAFTPAQASAVQPFQLGVVVEPRLDAISTTDWYLVATNQSALEHGYLDGAEGVQTEQEQGFEVDGLSIKARLDFGCGWGSAVGWVKADVT
ncbi:MAG: hypothetical protein C0445_13790 [Polaromonas sp.]|nr:hypothetical protein [Polaromonas sp.]